MSFRDFITNRLFRRRLAATLERYQNILLYAANHAGHFRENENPEGRE